MSSSEKNQRTHYISHDELAAKALENPAVARAYHLAAPRFAVIQDVINLRHAHGLTQSELANRATTHQSRISKIESGEYDVRLSTLIQLADALDADLEVHLMPRATSALFSPLFVQEVSPSKETVALQPSRTDMATKITLRS